MVSPEAKVKMGKAFDESLGESIRITVIATGFPSRSAPGATWRAPGCGRGRSAARYQGLRSRASSPTPGRPRRSPEDWIEARIPEAQDEEAETSRRLLMDLQNCSRP